MVFNRENHDVLLQKQFMQLIQENRKIKSPMQYFTDPRYLPFLLMKKTVRRGKEIRTSWKRFSIVKTMKSYLHEIYATNSRESKN